MFFSLEKLKINPYTEKDKVNMNSVVKIAFAIVGFFTKFVFVDRMCVIFHVDECPAMIDLTIPNGMVALSLLCTFGSCRFMQLLFRRQSLPKYMECALDGMVSTYLTDVSLRQLWIPLLNFAQRLCMHSSIFLMDLARGDLVTSVKPIAIWVRRDAMEVLRFGIAMMFVYTMLHVTGVIGALYRKYFEWFGQAVGDNMNWTDNPTFLLDDESNSSIVPSKSVVEDEMQMPPRTINLRKSNRTPPILRRKKVNFENL